MHNYLTKGIPAEKNGSRQWRFLTLLPPLSDMRLYLRKSTYPETGSGDGPMSLAHKAQRSGLTQREMGSLPGQGGGQVYPSLAKRPSRTAFGLPSLTIPGAGPGCKHRRALPVIGFIRHVHYAPTGDQC